MVMARTVKEVQADLDALEPQIRQANAAGFLDNTSRISMAHLLRHRAELDREKIAASRAELETPQ